MPNKLKISDGAAAVLVRLVAEQDAIFLPPRVNPLEKAWSNWWAARYGYHINGMPWRSGGKSEAATKEAERALKELGSERLVRPAKGVNRTVAIIVTERGDAVARSLADLLGTDGAVLDCRKMLKFEKSDWCYDGKWIAEIAFSEGRGWGDGHHQELGHTERWLIVPGIRGWAETGMTMRGRVFYRLTDAGRKVAAARRLPPEVEGLPEPSEKYQAIYGESLRNAIRALTTSTAPGRETGCGLISGGLSTLRELAEDDEADELIPV